MRIGIVTDSTADLPQELVREYEIAIIPLTVLMQGQEYRDGIDLTPSQFYHELKTGGLQPLTSQPSPGVFSATYRSLLTKFDALISIHLTERLSGTVRTAQLVKETMPEAKIKVIDSHSTSLGLGSLVLEAARAVKSGMLYNEVIELVNRLRDKVNFVVALDTLEQVCKGGRVHKLQAFLGSLFRIKPLLRLNQGEVEIVAKLRSHREAVAKLFEEFKANFAIDTENIIAVVHTAAEGEAQKLKEAVQETFKNVEIIFNQAGPVLGTHVGSGALALISVPKYQGLTSKL